MIVVQIPQPSNEITHFEKSCLKLIDDGFTIEEIARKFGTSSYEVLKAVSDGRRKGYKSGYEIKK